jgi:hypothetical protein
MNGRRPCSIHRTDLGWPECLLVVWSEPAAPSLHRFLEMNSLEALHEMEAAPGFEPGNNGFADRRLSHLAMPPRRVNYAAA